MNTDPFANYDSWLTRPYDLAEDRHHAEDLAEEELWNGIGDLTVSIQTVFEALPDRAAERDFESVIRRIAEALVEAECP